MCDMPRVSEQQFVESMQAEMTRVMAEVMKAVNDAPAGEWINASEWKVREAFAELRRNAYQRALQMRTEAAEGSFSPGGQAVAEQRPCESQHTDG
jgi:hypothetical protein